MASDTGRDDFIIAIRSAFLKKGTRQKFSLFTLLIISVLVLSLEYFKTGPVNIFRSFTKDLIFKGSYFISEPFVYIKDNRDLIHRESKERIRVVGRERYPVKTYATSSETLTIKSLPRTSTNTVQ